MIEEYKKLLWELVALKSISADSSCRDDIGRTASWLADTFRAHNFSVETINGYGNPLVLASYIADPSLETCLLYGHYDVQPAKKEEGWLTDPFVLTERNGRLYGRGAIDNKGQHLIHMLSLFDLIAKKQLGFNIKFMLEGNEEVGSPYMQKFIREKKDLRSCDVVLISDGELTAGLPTIEMSFRGVINATLTIKTADNDLHSGLYGGAAPNAISEAAKFIAGLHDKNNTVTIAGFYQDVESVTPGNNPFDMEKFKHNTTTKLLLTEPGYDFYTQTGQRPSLEITGIQSGYTGEGYRNSISGKAIVKLNIRLVPSQDPEKIIDAVRIYVKKVMPSYVDFSLSFDDIAKGIKLSIDNAYIRQAATILEKVYGTKPLQRYVGGSLPIVTDFENTLHVPQLLIPLANEDGMMHGLNENFDITFIEKALKFSMEFFRK